MEREVLRREPDRRFDQGRIEAHPLRARVDIGAGLLQHRPGAGMEKVHPDLFQRGQRGVMDRLEFVLRHELERSEWEEWLCGRLRWDGSGALTAAPTAGVLRPGFSGHGSPRVMRSRGTRRVRRPRANFAFAPIPQADAQAGGGTQFASAGGDYQAGRVAVRCWRPSEKFGGNFPSSRRTFLVASMRRAIPDAACSRRGRRRPQFRDQSQDVGKGTCRTDLGHQERKIAPASAPHDGVPRRDGVGRSRANRSHMNL